jgi:molybdate transport system substrate-binding protein
MLRYLATAASALLIWATPAAADELAILSAAAVRPALLELPALFGKATGHRVTVAFGNATAVQKKVVGGDKVDIVILPPRHLKTLIGDGHLNGDSRADLGVVLLGVAARAGAKAGPVATAEDFKAAMLKAASFGMPDPALGSTSSRFMVALLDKLGIAPAMKLKTRYFKDGTQALRALAKGEIALTISPMTSIRVVPGVELVGPLPDALQSKTVYAAALTRKSAASEPAKALMRMLTSKEFANVLRSKGIDPP